MARSFQNLRLFQGLTVYENVLVSALAAGHSKGEAAAITARELTAFDLGDLAGARASQLPYGARKRLEIARALAQDLSTLLLDEPAAGMNPAETDDLTTRLLEIGDARGIDILLIDHDLRFVNRLSNWIVVMNRGALIAQGEPEDVQSNPAVIEAYIGRGRTAAQSGYLAPYDGPSFASFEYCIDQINAAGGLNGTAPVLTMVGEHVFGSYPADNQQATVLAVHARDQGFSNVYLVQSPDSAYTLGGPEYFGTAFESLGGAIVGTSQYSLNQPDFSIIAAADPAPDVICDMGVGARLPRLHQGIARFRRCGDRRDTHLGRVP